MISKHACIPQKFITQFIVISFNSYIFEYFSDSNRNSHFAGIITDIINRSCFLGSSHIYRAGSQKSPTTNQLS